MVNVDKLQANLQYITDNPEEWYQGAWGRQTGCGTAFCLAGHAVVRDGYELAWERADIWDAEQGKTVTVWFANETVDGRDIPELAKEILELDTDGYSEEECDCGEWDDCYCGEGSEEGHYLFEPDRSLEEMWEWAGNESGGKIVPQSPVPT